jgi:hypothetical protein
MCQISDVMIVKRSGPAPAPSQGDRAKRLHMLAFVNTYPSIVLAIPADTQR